MSRAGQRRNVRRATHGSPWRRRRRRLAIAFLLIVALLSPALVWRVRLANEVREQFVALRAANRPVDLVSLDAALPTLTAEENGATLYGEAAEGFVNLPMESWQRLPFRKKVPLAPGEPLSPEMGESLEALVRENGSTLDVLYRASEFTQHRYVDHFDVSMGLSKLPHLGATESLVELLCADALLACEENAAERAIRDLTTAVALIDSLTTDGLWKSLQCQWEQDEKLLLVLARLMGQSVLSDEQLRPFQAHFDPLRRKQQWEGMCDVEQGLFLSRITEGRQGGPFRDLLVILGVADMNVRAYLNLMADIRQGFGSGPAEQGGRKDHYKAQERTLQRHPFIYVTVQANRPLFRWSMIRERWDEAQVAQVALALAAYRSVEGGYPAKLADLVPGFLPSLPEEVADGAQLHYHGTALGFRLWHKGNDGNDHVYWDVTPVP